MTLDAPNILGLLGCARTVLAYACSNIAKALDFTLFNRLNLIGLVLLIGLLSIHVNLGAMVMEIVWTLIAILGLAGGFWKRSRP